MTRLQYRGGQENECDRCGVGWVSARVTDGGSDERTRRGWWGISSMTRMVLVADKDRKANRKLETQYNDENVRYGRGRRIR